MADYQLEFQFKSESGGWFRRQHSRSTSAYRWGIPNEVSRSFTDVISRHGLEDMWYLELAGCTLTVAGGVRERTQGWGIPFEVGLWLPEECRTSFCQLKLNQKRTKSEAQLELPAPLDLERCDGWVTLGLNLNYLLLPTPPQDG